MKILIMSRRQFNDVMVKNNINDDNVEKFHDVIFISIGDSGKPSGFREQHFKENHPNVMVMQFDDVENEGIPTAFNKPAKAFSSSQAKELFQFIKKNRKARSCLVHCEAGISRSGAVGSFIQGYCKGDYEEFKRDNPHILPNGRVLRMLNREKYNDKE